MLELGGGLLAAKQFADALPVHEAALAAMRRLGEAEDNILAVQSNLAGTYEALGRHEALQMKRDVCIGYLKLYGAEHGETLIAANNYAALLAKLDRFKETKKLLRKNIPVARRVLGETCQLTLSMRWVYAKALYEDASTLDDLCEAVTTLESVAKSYKRVLGESHPETPKVHSVLEIARNKLARASESPESSAEPSRHRGS